MNRVCSTFVKHFIYILSVVIVGNSVLVYENLKLCCNFLINFKRLSSKARLFFSLFQQVGEHCLFFSREYRDRVKKENGRKMDIIALLGVRFGYEPVAPTLESTCFLGDSTDFLQIYYPDKRLNLERIKSGPAFDNDDGQAYVRYDNIPENEGDQIYCCFRQPLRLKIMNTTNFRAEPNEVVLDKEVYLSLYYLIGDHNNTLKLTQPFNLVEFKEKPESTSTTTPPTTTTTESSPKPNNSSSDSPGTSTSDSPRPTGTRQTQMRLSA